MAMPPDSPAQPPFIAQPSYHRVVATFGHRGASRPSNSAHERPAGAHPPRRVEYDNCVRSLKTKIERFVIVAVGDPGVAREQAALLHPPLVIRRLHPSWLPIVEVEMDHRQTGPRRQCLREGALPGPGQPGDDHAAAHRSRCIVRQGQPLKSVLEKGKPAREVSAMPRSSATHARRYTRLSTNTLVTTVVERTIKRSISGIGS